MLGHKAPVTPWTKLATDIFTFDNNNYLVVVDYTSHGPHSPQDTFHDMQELLQKYSDQYLLKTNYQPLSSVTMVYAMHQKTFPKEMNKLRIHHITTSTPSSPKQWACMKYMSKSAKPSYKRPRIQMRIHTSQ